MVKFETYDTYEVAFYMMFGYKPLKVLGRYPNCKFLVIVPKWLRFASSHLGILKKYRNNRLKLKKMIKKNRDIKIDAKVNKSKQWDFMCGAVAYRAVKLMVEAAKKGEINDKEIEKDIRSFMGGFKDGII